MWGGLLVGVLTQYNITDIISVLTMLLLLQCVQELHVTAGTPRLRFYSSAITNLTELRCGRSVGMRLELTDLVGSCMEALQVKATIVLRFSLFCSLTLPLPHPFSLSSKHPPSPSPPSRPPLPAARPSIALLLPRPSPLPH